MIGIVIKSHIRKNALYCVIEPLISRKDYEFTGPSGQITGVSQDVIESFDLQAIIGILKKSE